MTGSAEKFGKKLDAHIGELINLKTKINELLEFHKQWEEIFQKIEKITGKSEKISIRNELVYFTYQYDKYHIIVSDFYSLINAQFIDQRKSIFKDMIGGLNIKTEDELKKPKENINLIGDYYNSLSKEERETEREKLRAESAKQSRNWHEGYLREIFPSIKDDFIIREENVAELKSTFKEIAETIEPYRHHFNHKYESVITRRHNVADGLSVIQINELFEKYANYINLIDVIYRNVGHSFDMPYDYEQTIKSSIDLIIFGSVDGLFFRLGISDKNLKDNNGQNPDDPKWYCQLREQFYNTDKILSIVAK